MNIKSISLTVFCLIGLFSQLVLAQFSSRERSGRGGSGNHPLLKALDLNGDGSISSGELEEASESLLTLDKNKDGTISGNELRPDRFGRGRGPLNANEGERNGPARGQAGETRRRAGGPRPNDLGESLLDLGEPGIAWYPRLEDGISEAKRMNRPILFMAVASQCGGVPGVF
ncbi:MAG: hypothetical protein VX646_06160 [Verrucomicrobiota bacterium]|nr:hypothetical protein [Verrucomicrobiales bacterium]MEC9036258.1 hypothetical protein [Verrucomicrobiota bacterium]MEE2967444.1 hypothetical protein [Verrucomicrobiota bacterium]HAA88346.1 hypothetical protein [Verrucomicrobiales bacterium]|tara:strand:- start:1246 stop:1761 length:516 start_codon:yes stop_codon:yes gene_type:complete